MPSGFQPAIVPSVGHPERDARAVRQPGLRRDSWSAQHGEQMAVVWPLLIVAVFFPPSVRPYRALGS
jgi:hypothetical protein